MNDAELETLMNKGVMTIAPLLVDDVWTTIQIYYHDVLQNVSIKLY